MGSRGKGTQSFCVIVCGWLQGRSVNCSGYADQILVFFMWLRKSALIKKMFCIQSSLNGAPIPVFNTC
jgi:hypothetical protein